MSGTCKRAAFAMVVATGMLIVSAASAGAGASRGPEVMVRIESASQREILARGLTVRVSNKGTRNPIVTLRGFSSTYDVPDFTPLTKKRAVRLEGAKASDRSQRVTVVRLRLTAEGRKHLLDGRYYIQNVLTILYVFSKGRDLPFMHDIIS